MSKIFDLRRQISGILKNRNATNADLKRARELITEYQERIEEMKAQNADLETERTRLNGVLTELSDEVKGMQENINRITNAPFGCYNKIRGSGNRSHVCQES
jgi:chromosome segregation ATPase